MNRLSSKFCSRVLVETGLQAHEIPTGSAEDLLGGSILAREGDQYLVTFGYPTGPANDPVWEGPDAFRIVFLSKEY
jgi:hypothetical protein